MSFSNLLPLPSSYSLDPTRRVCLVCRSLECLALLTVEAFLFSFLYMYWVSLGYIRSIREGQSISICHDFTEVLSLFFPFTREMGARDSKMNRKLKRNRKKARSTLLSFSLEKFKNSNLFLPLEFFSTISTKWIAFSLCLCLENECSFRSRFRRFFPLFFVVKGKETETLTMPHVCLISHLSFCRLVK